MEFFLGRLWRSRYPARISNCPFEVDYYVIPQGGDLPGTDQIEEVNTSTTVWTDDDGVEIGRLTTTTWSSATVNADGEISEVSQKSFSTIETGGHISHLYSDNKTVDVKDARESF